MIAVAQATPATSRVEEPVSGGGAVLAEARAIANAAHKAEAEAPFRYTASNISALDTARPLAHNGAHARRHPKSFFCHLAILSRPQPDRTRRCGQQRRQQNAEREGVIAE